MFKQLNQSKRDNIHVISLDDEFYEYRGKKPDYAIVCDGCIILIEVKLRLLSVEARFLGNRKFVVDECRVNSPIHKALVQLSQFEDFISSNDTIFGKPKEIIKLIVSFDALYMGTSYIIPIAAQEFGEELTRGVQIATLSDIETIGQALFSSHDVVTSLLEKSKSVSSIGTPIAMYLEDHVEKMDYEGCVTDKSKNEFLKMLTRSDKQLFNG